MSDDDPRALLRPLLTQRLVPSERRSIAADLRAIADEQEQLADADERTGPAVRRARIETANTQRRGGRPKGSGGRFIRYAPGYGHSGQLHIAPALYEEIGAPERISLQRVEGRLVLRPCGRGVGYAVTFPTGARGGMPRISIGQEKAEALGLVKGRITARIESGAIVAE